MRTRREQMASRRWSPSLDYLESRNLLSVSRAAAPLSEFASSPKPVSFVATETLTSRSASTPVGGIITVSTTTDGTGSLLGRFTTAASVNVTSSPPLTGKDSVPVTDGTITFTTAKGSLTGTFGSIPSYATYFINSQTGDEHVVGTQYIIITGGTGKFAGATGLDTRLVNYDVTTGTGFNKDFGWIVLT